MILRRLAESLRRQDWFTVGLEVAIVVIGVFTGIEVANWNEARLEAQRREEIIDALKTNLGDAISVQQRFVAEISRGLSDWEAAHARGEQPPPFYYRIDGSDTAPETWSTFEQMQLADLFDPVTLFDLAFFYSELDGIGRKYLRYVTFVEQRLLPDLIRGTEAFYDADGRLDPDYQANMQRLQEYQLETEKMIRWARCLVYRLEAGRTFDRNCRRADFQLPGMDSRLNGMEVEL